MTLDVATTGQMAGLLFGQALLELADGAAPTTWPLSAIGRHRGSEQFQMVTFPEGMTEAVSRWLKDPDLVDAALLCHPEQGAIELMLAICDGTDRLDVIVRFLVAVSYETRRPVTTFPIYDTQCELPLVEEFLGYVNDGLSQHKRANELDGSIGALGQQSSWKRPT
jgi:hypothetical protein